MTTVGIVGAGVMGAGIAQVALEAGWDVVIHDVDVGATERARDRVRFGLGRRAAKLDLDSDSMDAWIDGRLSGLRTGVSLDAVADGTTLVIEAALEDLDLKRSIFGKIDATAPPDVVLATNTSALAIGSIAEGATRPERVIGLHFFNPVPLMALVEVVPGARTEPAILERATTWMRDWGKTPVVCADRPGFIVNRVNRPFTIEALRMLEEGAASVEAIDGAMRDAGFPMGPFELMDLAGLDVNLAAAEGVWHGLGEPDHLRPSPIQAQLVAAGNLGRKTGRGFYRYDDGRRGVVATKAAAAPPTGTLDAAAIRDRIVAGILAEAQRAVADGVATPETIDLAMCLGAGHPRGPFGQPSPAIER
ncbi:MAG: 3-hydroxybutyryl-CoA dehydrogenase [Chloroflexi bacterium]|nr:3-hydroxybutyryl-CoA dehydrogenase [Chloroflexota bacterium]